jgi:DNA repair protein RecO (recombination protein O)
MQWRDEGILLWVRRHGENAAIIETLTAEHGRHAGLVRGGTSKSHAAILQPGAQLSLEWSARLAEHLGTFKVDLVRARAGVLLTDRDKLAALNVISALLVQFVPDREPDPVLYETTLSLMDDLAGDDPAWPVAYARWENALLGALGFGLDFSRCAATGISDNLVYVSPRSGRAVCRQAGGPYADKMLPLPQFLLGRGTATIADVREALRLTGYFFKHWVCPAFEAKELPASRARLTRLLEKYVMDPPEEQEEEFTEEERAWLRQWEEKEAARASENQEATG